MAEHEFDPFLAAEIGEPVPGKHAFHADHQIAPERRYRVKKGFRRTGNIAVQQHFTPCIQDAEEHFLRMEIDSAVVLVIFCVKSHV